MKLTYDILRTALESGAAAFRARTRLQPIGGEGDKVFPPTFGDTVEVRLQPTTANAKPETHKTRYAVEYRRIDGADVLCVQLDTVASQANRLEEALQEAWDDGRLNFGMVRVDFTGATHDDPTLDLSTLGGDGYITALEAPHRLADALLRDSTLDGIRFRASEPGRALTESGPKNATSLYALCPTALVFGMWDSTGPKGGLGAKFQRALVSEIVGVNIAFGRKTASRLDPVGVEKQGATIYQAADEDERWTLDEAEAAKDKKKPIIYKAKDGTDGAPSSINHGNIKPSIDFEAGGVTMDYAEQITVLSLPALRRLRFPKKVDGSPVDRAERRQAETSARTALAALALAAVSLHRDHGFDLRSRCALAPQGDLELELVQRDGNTDGPYTLTSDEAAALLAKAAEVAAKDGFDWPADPVNLVPAPKLVALIRKSRERSTPEGDDA